MNELLIGPLFREIMNWNAENVAHERPFIEVLSSTKYDNYQNFTTGMRFLESLALWLEQFETEKEKMLAYDFFKEKLVYISRDELLHLVSVTYADHIKRILIQETSKILFLEEWSINQIINSQEFRNNKIRSLFLGLSDGANIGEFRRSNFDVLDHEQILRSQEISEDRCTELFEFLDNKLSNVKKEGKPIDKSFCNIFLLDDFSGSGSSCIGKKEDGEFRGKINKLYESIQDGNQSKIFDLDNLNIFLVLYIATEEAINYLTKMTKELFQDKVNFKILVVNKLPNNIKIESNDDEFIILLKKYFDDSIINKSYKTGKHKEPYLGYNECGLPLVLYHNTPNNTIPLIWFNESHSVTGLFPRIDRHSE